MKIALVGYGKMGKAIEEIALSRGHEITHKINSLLPIESCDLSETDVAIEFSRPELVLKHIDYCLDNSTPIVVGTTAWNESLEKVTSDVMQKNGGLLHASNFSVGVNIFFEMNKHLAKIMNYHPSYSAKIEEIHHIHKIDAPSGTAITIAEDLMLASDKYESWLLGEEDTPVTNEHQLPVVSYRINEVPGTHTVEYSSSIDTITMTHEAHNRQGFALGAVLAAEFLANKKGVFTMSDVLKF